MWVGCVDLYRDVLFVLLDKKNSFLPRIAEKYFPEVSRNNASTFSILMKDLPVTSIFFFWAFMQIREQQRDPHALQLLVASTLLTLIATSTVWSN